MAMTTSSPVRGTISSLGRGTIPSRGISSIGSSTSSGSATSVPSETTTFSCLQRHSASSYSVETSVGHISAVVNGDVGSLSQTGAVI